MMGKTHLYIGVSAALSIIAANSPAEYVAVIAGGAIGGVIPDVDILRNDYKNDALIGELLAFGITAVAAACDFFFKWGICQSVIENKTISLIGSVGFAIMWIIGFIQEHRAFTHSIISMLLFSLCLAMVYIPLGIAAFIGYFSHLLLDLLNKKGIQFFFPSKIRICLKLFYAGKTADKIFMWLGFVAAIALAVYRIITMQ